MLQIDHVYEFFYKVLFKDFVVFTLPNGVPKIKESLDQYDLHIFINNSKNKLLFWDQEPVTDNLFLQYLELTKNLHEDNILSVVTSERSPYLNNIANQHNLHNLYYFFHGFAALDWFRGYGALYQGRPVCRDYFYDYVSFNRLTTNDRSYRLYFLSQLVKNDLIHEGKISFGVSNDDNWTEELSNPYTKLSAHAVNNIKEFLPKLLCPQVIDHTVIPGSASADIPRTIDECFWHVVSETVFYYDKLHLTEKIFKPIVMKQPFLLLASPGNLAYLRSYGFKTFSTIVDEKYDDIVDPDQRIDAVIKIIKWYYDLSNNEKLNVIRECEPIIEHNFKHFYGSFKHIITQELLTNTKILFKEIGYDDSNISYADIYRGLTL